MKPIARVSEHTPYFYDFYDSFSILFDLNFFDIPLKMDAFQAHQAQVQHKFEQLHAEITTLRAQLTVTTPPRLRARLPDPKKFVRSTYKFDT
jgi:hypothetical protein